MCTSKPHLHVHVLTLETVLVDVPKAEHAHSKPCSSHTTSLQDQGRRGETSLHRAEGGREEHAQYCTCGHRGREGREGGREGREGKEGSIHSLLCL